MNGLFYTAISRVKTGDSLFIKNFKENYIQANENVEKKRHAMEMYSKYEFKKIYLDENIFDSNEELKLGYVNTRGLLKGSSLEFINSDINLQHLDYLVIAETWLTKNTSSNYLSERLPSWQIVARFDANDGKEHMGLLVLKSKTHSVQGEMKRLQDHTFRKQKSVFAQVIQADFEEYLLPVCFCYINRTPTNNEVSQLSDLLKSSELLMGDINLDFARPEDVEKLKKISGESKTRVLHETTTDSYSQLDHILLNKTVWVNSYSTSYHNYTSDHKVIAIRIANPFKSNHFSEQFKQRIHLNESQVTIIGQKRKAAPFSLSPTPSKQAKVYRKRKTEDNPNHSSPVKISRNVPVDHLLPMLTEDMLTTINEVLALTDETVLVSDHFACQIRRRTLNELKPRVWLGDETINFMFRLIETSRNDTHSFLLGFSQTLQSSIGSYDAVCRYTNRIQDLFAFKKVLIPVNPGYHWTLVGIDMERKSITYFDSLNGTNQVGTTINLKVLLIKI